MADAGEDHGAFKGDLVVLDGSGSQDPDDDLMSYRWTQTAGEPVALDDPAQSRTVFTAPTTSGPLTFSLVVSDEDSASAADEVTVMVENRPPVAEAGDDLSGEGGSTVTLDGSQSTDPDADPLTYDWLQLSGPAVELANNDGPTAQFTAPDDGGEFEFSLTVTDADGGSDSDTARVNLTPVVIDPPPIADAGPDQTVAKGRSFYLRGAGSDPEGQPITVDWVQTRGAAASILNPDRFLTEVDTPPGETVLEFELRVSDGISVTSDRVSVTMQNTPPDVLELQLSPENAGTLDPLTVNARPYDDDGDEVTLSYRWSVNDTELPDENSEQLSPDYYERGDVVVVTVTADDGQDTTNADASITIVDTPLRLLAENAPTDVNYEEPVSFRVTVDDPDGDTVAGYTVRFGPIGMEVDDTGLVTWTPGGPMLQRTLDVNWQIASSNNAYEQNVGGTIRVHDPSRDEPIRRTGIDVPIWSDGLEIGDFDNDGETEALVLAQFAVYELGYQEGAYVQKWMYPFSLSQYGVPMALAADDVDGDAESEIFVASGTELSMLDGQSRQKIMNVSVPETRYCRDLELADLDLDGEAELVCLGLDSDLPQEEDGAVYVFDARTLALEWETEAQSLGRTIAVGNVDADPALEIVAGNGYVYDGITRAIDWTSASEFGFNVDTGDIDGDGIEEIVGASKWVTNGLRAFDAAARTLLWQIEVGDVESLTVADTDGDDLDEILVGDGQWGYVTGYRHNPIGSPAVLFEVNLQDNGSTAIQVGDLDGDGESELIWGSGSAVVVASVGPAPVVEWNSEDSGILLGPYKGGQLTEAQPGNESLTFAPRANGVVSMRPNGRLVLSPDFGRDLSSLGAIDVADIDDNGIDEVLMGSDSYSRAAYAAMDIDSGVPLWSSTPDQAGAKAIAHADLSRDGVPELVTMTGEGIARAYDMIEQRVHWETGDLGLGVDIEVADLDADGLQEIYAASSDRVVRYDYDEDAGRYAETGFYLIPGVTDITTGDLDGDGLGELYVLYGSQSRTREIIRYNSAFLEGPRILLGFYMQGIYVEDWGDGRKNLIVARDANSGQYDTGSSLLIALDLVSGAEVWRSPPVPGDFTKNSVNFVEFESAPGIRMSFGTTYGMYLTR